MSSKAHSDAGEDRDWSEAEFESRELHSLPVNLRLLTEQPRPKTSGCKLCNLSLVAFSLVAIYFLHGCYLIYIRDSTIYSQSMVRDAFDESHSVSGEDGF